MKTFKMLFSVLIASTVLCSCSNGEENGPLVASTVLNSLYVSVSDKQGEPMNSAELLSDGGFSVIEKKSKKRAKVAVRDYEGTEMLAFDVGLPDMKSMVYNEDRTEAQGSVEFVRNLNGMKMPMIVNFIFTSSKDAAMFGGNGIRIKSIEYSNKTIRPTEKMGINSIRIRYDGKNTAIEPW